MKKTTRTTKRTGSRGGVTGAPGPIGRSARVTDRGLPPAFFGDDVPVRGSGTRRGTVRRSVAVPALVEDVTVRRSLGEVA